jgi:hypothetical protein
VVDLINKIDNQQPLTILISYDTPININLHEINQADILNQLYGTSKDDDEQSYGYLYKQDF